MSCYLLYLLLLNSANALPSLLAGTDPFIVKEYIDAITAYGPGLGVYTPYRYVDISYDNIPFVGNMIPIIGKEGTSSRLGISPFYPPEGNPSNPFPPLYRAQPLPLHVPEPQDIVAVPLDEEALHGEPLFPPELVLPSEMEMIETRPIEESDANIPRPTNPFEDESNSILGRKDQQDNLVQWPTSAGGLSTVDNRNPTAKNSIKAEQEDRVVDAVTEHNSSAAQLSQFKPDRDGGSKTPLTRSKRVRRLAQLLN